MLRVDCRAVGLGIFYVQIPDFSVDFCGLVLPVNLVENQSVFHLEFGIFSDDLVFELELDYRDCLVNSLPVHVAVIFHAERHERSEVDSVSFLENVKIVVSRAETHNVRDALLASCSRAHPDNIVVSPLNIDGMVVQKCVED